MDPQKFIIDSLNESSETKLKIKDQLTDEIIKAVDILVSAYKDGNKLTTLR